MRLTQYGIRNEKSDIRAHVCPVARRIYVFPTHSGIDAVDSGRYRKVDGYQAGVDGRTAAGFLVPPMDLAGVVRLGVRQGVWTALGIQENDSLPVKGRKATRLVSDMIREGLFPIPGGTYQDATLDIDGTDILFRAHSVERRIQVKCDYPGGEERFGGTGHLYLQVAERNPRGLHEEEQCLPATPSANGEV